jgi:hypothetical protein
LKPVDDKERVRTEKVKENRSTSARSTTAATRHGSGRNQEQIAKKSGAGCKQESGTLGRCVEEEAEEIICV